MSNITGLVPYIELSKTAKSYGGPKNYICTLRSSEYASGYSVGYSSGNVSGFIVGCAVTGLLVGAVAGARWLYKRYKANKENDEYVQWNRK